MKHIINLPFMYETEAFAPLMEGLKAHITQSELRFLEDMRKLNFTTNDIMDYHVPTGTIPHDIFMLREEQYKEKALEFVQKMYESAGLEFPLTEYHLENPQHLSRDSDEMHAYHSFELALDLIRYNASVEEEISDLQENLAYLEDDGLFMLSFYHVGWEKFHCPMIVKLLMWKNNLIAHQHQFYNIHNDFINTRKYLMDDNNVRECYKEHIDQAYQHLDTFYKTCIHFEYCIDMRIKWVLEKYDKIKKAKK